MLERDERRHQLRDARHRAPGVRVAGGERVTVDRALDDVRTRLHGGHGPLRGSADEEHGHREGETEAQHGAEM